jgi:hypothetical protein
VGKTTVPILVCPTALLDDRAELLELSLRAEESTELCKWIRDLAEVVRDLWIY